MITPDQAKAHALQDAVRLEQHIDEILIRTAVSGHWPATIAIDLISIAGVREILVPYQEAGWVATIVRDDREGDYIRFETP